MKIMIGTGIQLNQNRTTILWFFYYWCILNLGCVNNEKNNVINSIIISN